MKQAMLDFRIEHCRMPPVCVGDKQGIPRLLSILLENASKYTPPGGAVKLRATVEATRFFFSVCDTGIGIAPEHKLRIFDRFYRAPVGRAKHSPRLGPGPRFSQVDCRAPRYPAFG